MKKETKSQIKSEVLNGMSSGVGAAVGVVIGHVIASEANAAEVPEPNIIPEPMPEPTPEPIPEPIPTPIPEPEIQVLGYERVLNNDGSQMDVAVINIAGQDAVVVDGNIDGTADVIAIDVNGNGMVDDGEIMDVSGQGIPMQPFQQEVMQPEPVFIAQEQDYVNNADVHEFMA